MYSQFMMHGQKNIKINNCAYCRVWNVVNHSLSLAIVFKPGILCSMEIVHLFHNMSVYVL